MRFVNARSVVSVVILAGITAYACLSLMVNSSRSQTSDRVQPTLSDPCDEGPSLALSERVADTPANGLANAAPELLEDALLDFDELPMLNAAPAAERPSREQVEEEEEEEDTSGLKELVREILMIRQKQGTLLKGTLLERPPGEPPADSTTDGETLREFEDLLRQVAEAKPMPEPLPPSPNAGEVRQTSAGVPIPEGAQDASRPPTIAPAAAQPFNAAPLYDAPPVDSRSNSPWTTAPTERDPPPTNIPPTRAASVADSPMSHAALFAAGRALDERAATLEQQGQFEAAERLRRLGRRIRQEARQWAEATSLR